VTSTFWGLAAQVAEARPDRVVLLDDYGRSMTAIELVRAAEGVAADLYGRGIKPGSVVSWQLPTTLEGMTVMLALTRLGVVQNPIIPVLREREIRFITGQIGTEWFLVPVSWRGFDHVALASAIGADVGFEVVPVDQHSDPMAGLRIARADPAGLPDPSADADAVRWIYFSSGTASDPKGVRHTDRTVIGGSASLVAMVGEHNDDIDVFSFPITHIGGAAMLAADLLTGMGMLLCDTFDPVETPKRVAGFGPTLLGGATPFFMAYVMAQQAHGDERLFPRLRACIGGGAPLTPELNRQVRDLLGVPGVANAWGLTEFPVATSPMPDAPFDVLEQTVGPPVPGVTVRVVDDEGNECPPGAEGELRLKGPQCFVGYVDARLDLNAFDADGWFRTGDLGSIDGAGNVRVTGRIKDAIIRNAENIAAQEIEEILTTHPAVQDVAVIGVPDPRTGEKVCAVVVPAAGADVDLPTLVAYCRESGLAAYKLPERLEIVEVLPRNDMGKVLKRVLRTTYS
jgi:acyl-CoA synthetase (AMP-forming)/AMP-acid ligase II